MARSNRIPTWLALLCGGIVSGFLPSNAGSTSSRGCAQEKQKYGIVCRCNATYCDTVAPIGGLKEGEVAVYSSNKDGDRLVRSTVYSNASHATFDASRGGENLVDVDEKSQFQRIIGFGGAFTDAAAGVIFGMNSSAARQNLIASYFSDEGLRYSLGRVHIGSCDFSRVSYSLNPVDGDTSMAMFQLRDDRRPTNQGGEGAPLLSSNDKGDDQSSSLSAADDYKIDLIRLAQKEVSKGRNLSIFASIWSAPLWMKTCESPPNSHHGNACKSPSITKGALSANSTIRAAYALYLRKFIDAYTEAEIPIWGVTTQNEPSGNPMGNGWESMYFTPSDMADFIDSHLGPELKGKYPEIKIMNGDDQLPHIMAHAELASKSRYIDGVAYHWYASLAAELEDTKPLFSSVGGGIEVRGASQRYQLDNQGGRGFLLATEACNGYLPTLLPGESHVMPGSWKRGYRYARDILHQINNNASGWSDWNLALDSQGGPNHAKNFVDSPIIVDAPEQGAFFKQPMFYAIGHFAAFVPEGSVRLSINGLVDSKVGEDSIEATAFLTPEGHVVVVAINDRLHVTKRLRECSIVVRSRGREVRLSMKENEIKTIIFK